MQNAKILVVDDEAANTRVLELALAKAHYTNVLSTNDSRQAQALFKQFNPDLVLLDLNMPDMDGFEVLEQLKQLIAQDTYLPVLVLTSDGTVETRRRALGAGAKDFLTKPLDYTEVLLRIQNLLETRYLHLELRRQRHLLDEKVHERTLELQNELNKLRVEREMAKRS